MAESHGQSYSPRRAMGPFLRDPRIFVARMRPSPPKMATHTEESLVKSGVPRGEGPQGSAPAQERNKQKTEQPWRNRLPLLQGTLSLGYKETRNVCGGYLIGVTKGKEKDTTVLGVTSLLQNTSTWRFLVSSGQNQAWDLANNVLY